MLLRVSEILSIHCQDGPTFRPKLLYTIQSLRATQLYIRLVTATLPRNLHRSFLTGLSLDPDVVHVVTSGSPILTSDNRAAFVESFSEKDAATLRAFDLLKKHRDEQPCYKALVIAPSLEGFNIVFIIVH